MARHRRSARARASKRSGRKAALRITSQTPASVDTGIRPTTAARISLGVSINTTPLPTGDHHAPPAQRISAVPAAASVPLRDADAAYNLEDYVERIESAAARARSGAPGSVSYKATQSATITAIDDDGRSVIRQTPARAVRRRVRKKKPWYRRRKTWFLCAAIVPVLVGLVTTLYVLNILRLGVGAYQEINQPQAARTRWTVNPAGTPVPVPDDETDLVLPDWSQKDPINIALLGVDTRVGDDMPPRSDTTIVVHIDPKQNTVAMMSIPRDLKVFIPGFGEDKFNAAYPLGEAHSDELDGGGPTLVAQTIEANFNIPIHYYATIDFNGFKKLVDTVGGVVVDVPEPLSDDQYPTDDLRLTRVYFPTGLQKLDGTTALQYVRTRHADNDIGRADRQQQVLMAIREEAIGKDLITQAPDLINDLKDTLRTDLNFNEMLALANLGRQIDENDIARLNLWTAGLLTEQLPQAEGDPYYLIADWPAIHEYQAAYFGTSIGDSDTAANSTASATTNLKLDVPVFVENGTDVPQLASNSAQILVDAGFTAVWPSDAREHHDTSVIEYYADDDATAQYVAASLGLNDAAIIPGTGGNGITVTLGDDAPDALRPTADAGAGGG